MRVSIVIPNYNGAKFLPGCINSLKKQLYTDYELILVDNNSEDNSVTVARELFDEIRIVSMEGNTGFSRAVNAGIREAKGEFVVLLNNDTVAKENWLGCLVNCMEENSTAFSCSSKMIMFNDRDKIDDSGDAYTIFGWAYQEGNGQSIKHFNKNVEVFSSCAGAAIYRRELFDRIGLFDEAFFAYLEDVDIGYRAQLMGYKNIFCATAEIYHIGSATTGGGYSPIKVKLSARNNIYLIYKNMPVFQLAINMPCLIIGHLFKYMFFRKKGLANYYVEGVQEGLKERKKLIKTQHVKASRYIYIQYWLVFKGIYYAFHKLKRMIIHI
ncbi:glycosyltransferase family 2 protein [Paenibacillus polymyxa]|uniref:glycosyltransferase family 2 protein n=1 Tax=Paenibacillus polymyxa TaxID=1406 RepID=UPI002AB3D6E1|nr:glycosyltransferase family 2 protein [Paenibacillus polymyxa]MDY8049376.1 glycosyltransferase family 2 protein [Paenibacillus polymyxa]